MLRWFEIRQEQADERISGKAPGVEIEPGWHLYALDQPAGGPIPTTIKIGRGESVRATLAISDSPMPTVKPDPNFVVDGKPLETRYFENEAEFMISVSRR